MSARDQVIPPPQNETISQSEVERLLAQLGTGEAADLQPPVQRGGRSSVDTALLQRHDFRQFSFFSAGELRKLRVRQEVFIKGLAARVSLYLRLEVGMQMVTLETMPYQKFVESLTNPTHLELVRVTPLNGICLLDIPTRLALAVVDRELGGPGACLEDPRELSSMESRLLSQVVEILVSEWCGSWRDLLDLRPVLLEHESSSRFLETSPPDHTMLVLGIEVRIGDLTEQLHFAFPHDALEPLMVKLNAGPDTAAKPTGPKAVPARKWNPVLSDAKVRVTAELRSLELTAGELANLKPGDTLLLTPDLFQDVRICLERVPKFIGSLGTAGEHRAVQIKHGV